MQKSMMNISSTLLLLAAELQATNQKRLPISFDKAAELDNVYLPY